MLHRCWITSRSKIFIYFSLKKRNIYFTLKSLFISLYFPHLVSWPGYCLQTVCSGNHRAYVVSVSFRVVVLCCHRITVLCYLVSSIRKAFFIFIFICFSWFLSCLCQEMLSRLLYHGLMKNSWYI